MFLNHSNRQAIPSTMLLFRSSRFLTFFAILLVIFVVPSISNAQSAVTISEWIYNMIGTQNAQNKVAELAAAGCPGSFVIGAWAPPNTYPPRLAYIGGAVIDSNLAEEQLASPITNRQEFKCYLIVSSGPGPFWNTRGKTLSCASGDAPTWMRFGIVFAMACPTVPKVVVIDPGHGGTSCAANGTKTGGDTGTTGPTYKDTEHALALSIGLSLRDKLSSKGYKVIMTRTTAVCPGLRMRADIANNAKANVFVSIHFNGVDDPKVNGTEVHTLKVNTLGWQIATSTSDKLSSILGTTDRGPKATNLSVLRNTKMPSILVEVAFLSNVRGDEDIMHRPASPVDAATAIASSVDAFLSK